MCDVENPQFQIAFFDGLLLCNCILTQARKIRVSVFSYVIFSVRFDFIFFTFYILLKEHKRLGLATFISLFFYTRH